MYAYVLVFVNAVGVTSYSPPLTNGSECNVMKQAVESVDNSLVGRSRCVRIELAKGK